MASRGRSVKFKIIYFVLSLITALILYFAAVFIKDYSKLSGSVVPIIIIVVGYAVVARYLNKFAEYLANKLGE